MHGKWLRLDNAARMYAATRGSRSPTSFRIGFVLKAPVDPPVLQTALDELLQRFPYFLMGLKHGLFWPFLQQLKSRPLVLKESAMPCQEFSLHRPLFRILFYRNRISAEFSHVLTDGVGGLTFTRSLVAHYFRLKGIQYAILPDLPSPGEHPHAEESEDAYERFFPGDIPAPPRQDAAFHLRGEVLSNGDLHVITGSCQASSVVSVCKRLNVSVNDFFAAHYLWALYRSCPDTHKPIRIMMPVNMRDMFPSKTMRNFFLTTSAEIRPRLGVYSFEEILKKVHLAVRIGVDDKAMYQQISRNVGLARNPALRLIPLFIKLPIERFLFFTQGNGPLSGIFSNIGRITMPKELEPHIERVVFLTSPNHITRMTLGAAGFGDCITLTFTSLIASTELPRLFFTALREQGIVSSIESNKETTSCPTAPVAA